MIREFDVVVLGGGTGGYAAAFRARELGLTTVIIERDKLGGTCLHYGCIPTKALLHIADIIENLNVLPEVGLHITHGSICWDEVQKKKEDIVAGAFRGLKELAAARGVEVIKGEGSIGEEDYVDVNAQGRSERIAFKNLVIATGSKPRSAPNVEIDGQSVITSKEALLLPKPPGSVLVLGGGYIGVEFASLWKTFGAEVTIIEMTPRLLPNEDIEISAALVKSFEARGIKIMLGTRFESVVVEGGVTAEVWHNGGSRKLEAEKVMVAAGRDPVLKEAQRAGVEMLNGYVKVDNKLETSRHNVFAVGDLLPTPQLAHAATAEGIYAAEVIAGQDPEQINYMALPRCIYSYPEVASVGMTETSARENGYEVKTAKVPFASNARFMISGETDGEVKIIAEKDGPILGVHMIGAKVSELISQAMLMVGWEAYPEDVAKMIYPHPTFSEVIGEANLRLRKKDLRGFI